MWRTRRAWSVADGSGYVFYRFPPLTFRSIELFTDTQIVRTEDDNSAVDIFPSFSSGTLLVTNRAQRGRDDVAVFGTPKNSGDVPETAEETEESAEQKNISGLGEGKLRAKPVAKRSTGRPVPLAVLNMFELSYLGGKYGVWSRGEYARDWFRSLDWNKVEKRAASVQ